MATCPRVKQSCASLASDAFFETGFDFETGFEFSVAAVRQFRVSHARIRFKR
jgi:hypothetical protein